MSKNKTAVVRSGNKQFLVAIGDVIDIDLIANSHKDISLDTLMIIEELGVKIGTPLLEKQVLAEVVEELIKGDKVTAIRYKAKKRVKKVRGHRQNYTSIRIKQID